MANILDEDKAFRLWVLMDRTRRAMYKLRKKELRRYGISAVEAAALFTINAIELRGKDVTPAEISRWMLREPHSVSVLLQRMEKKALISRDKYLHKKNLVKVSLTEKGQKALEGANKRQSIHQLVSVISDEEREQCETILRKLRKQAYISAGVEYKPPFP